MHQRLERARPGAGVVGRAAPADPRPGPDRDGEGDVRRVDAAGAPLGGRVPRLLGPARGLRLRRRHPDRRSSRGPRRARSRRRSRCASSSPARRSSSPRTRVDVPVTTQVTPRDPRRPARREAQPPRRQGHPVGDQGPRPLRQVAGAAAGAGRLRRPDRPPLRRGDEHRPPRRRRRAGDPHRRRRRPLPLGRELEDARADVRPRQRRALRGDLPASSATPRATWQELREYYCPLSGRLLETEAVPPGYPVMHEYLPDIEGFYKGWLKRDLPA